MHKDIVVDPFLMRNQGSLKYIHTQRGRKRKKKACMEGRMDRQTDGQTGIDSTL